MSPYAVLSAGMRLQPGIPDWPQFSGRRVALTQSCRTAIAFARSALGLREGDEVLMPAYNCGTEIDALLASGLSVRCVDTDWQGMLSLDTIRDAASDRTRAIYIIHPFGWPHPLDEIDAWRKQHGLFLIEDCALSLFSSSAGGIPTGTTGDISVYSFPKSLATPDGGAISWTTSWAGPTNLKPAPRIKTLRQLLSLSKKFALRHVPARTAGCDDALNQIASSNVELGDIPEHYYFEGWRAERDCPVITKRLITISTELEIKKRRRENFLALADALKGSGVQLLYPKLDAGVCPLCCPVVAENRNALVQEFRSQAVATSQWWDGGHRAIDWKQFPEAVQLKRSILPVPVHQQLIGSDMLRIAKILRSW